METLIAMISIWAPSLVAILGVVSTILIALGSTKDAFNKLKKDETLKEVKEELQKSVSQNKELAQVNMMLLDEITKIKNYYENRKGV